MKPTREERLEAALRELVSACEKQAAVTGRESLHLRIKRQNATKLLAELHAEREAEASRALSEIMPCDLTEEELDQLAEQLRAKNPRPYAVNSFVRRKLRCGILKAWRVLEELERRGVVSKEVDCGRTVLFEPHADAPATKRTPSAGTEPDVLGS